MAFPDAVDELWDNLVADGAAVDVDIYPEAGGGPISLTAVKGVRNTQIDNGDFVETLTFAEFIFKVSEMIAASWFPPARRDFLEWDDEHGTTHRMEVNLPGGEREYDNVDQFQKLFRVHTKEVTRTTGLPSGFDSGFDVGFGVPDPPLTGGFDNGFDSGFGGPSATTGFDSGFDDGFG